MEGSQNEIDSNRIPRWKTAKKKKVCDRWSSKYALVTLKWRKKKINALDGVLNLD